jgi:geranylgeranyl diphosphate synthase type I
MPMPVRLPVPVAIPAETAHDNAPIEWWFLQGRFNGPELSPRHFMFVFFQQRHPLKNGREAIGHVLLASQLDPATNRHDFLSRISQPVIEVYLSNLQDIKQHRLDPAMVALLSDEIKRFGPPQPVILETAPVSMAADRLHCTWADMTLSQTGHQFHVQYNSPEDGCVCSFALTPCRPRFFHEADAAQDVPMSYACIPRLTLSGTVGTQEVSGEAWFDHQWGDYELFKTSGPDERILGWEWLGINLDDGTDLMLSIRRDMQSNTILAKHAFYSEAGDYRELSRFDMRATRLWESRKTFCRYPVDWQLDVSEAGLQLTIAPLADDQEVFLFGIMRAVWEGACIVKGTRNGRPVTGRARLELQGYGYVFDFRTYLNRWIERIDAMILDFVPPVLDRDALRRYLGESDGYDLEAHNAMLAEPVWDMLRRGGKRWRPIFGALLLQALGKSYLPYEQLLYASIELSHLGSLIIDDIEDQSLLRRGEPAIHLRYGIDLAINTGNTLYMLPLLLLEDHPDLSVAQRERIYQVIVRQYVRSHFGQSMDIYWSKFGSPENLDRWVQEGLAEKVFRMYADKTGASVVGLAQMACIVAEADPFTRNACATFAEAFGVAFQILDDVLNFDRSGHWRKTVGEDLAMGKPTYVIIKALMAVDGKRYDMLRRLLCNPTYRRDPANLEKGIAIICESGALESCRQQAQDMVRQNWDNMAEILQPSEAKTMLRLLCANLTDLTFVS